MDIKEGLIYSTFEMFICVIVRYFVCKNYANFTFIQ